MADTTVRDDRRLKVTLYARAGLREVWLVDINARQIDVFRGPADGAFGQVTRADGDDDLAPLAFPDLHAVPAKILPGATG